MITTRTCYVKLLTLPAAQAFTSIAMEFTNDIIVTSGRFTVNAKSVLGIFSLDLSKPLQVEFETENEEDFTRFVETLRASKIHVKTRICGRKPC